MCVVALAASELRPLRDQMERRRVIHASDTPRATKQELGQYFTVSNPFTLKPFTDWLHSIPSYESLKYIEPFAGENNIPNMIDGSVAKDLDWSCFDIEPKPTNRYSKAQIQKRDTVLDFPKGYDVAITNPPYLAKNSAKRLKLAFPDTKYDDIYKQCLDTMLANVGYVAAIIPETYIISGLFHKRLNSVISLTCRMFDDTECPVCLAMFNKALRSCKHHLRDFDVMFRSFIECGIYYLASAERTFHVCYFFGTFVHQQHEQIYIRIFLFYAMRYPLQQYSFTCLRSSDDESALSFADRSHQVYQSGGKISVAVLK